MARKNKMNFRRDSRYALRYFYNRQQYVLAKNSKGRFSFYDINEIYNNPDYLIVTDMKHKKSVEVAEQFTKKNMEYIGYDVDVEPIDIRFLKQQGYLK